MLGEKCLAENTRILNWEVMFDEKKTYSCSTGTLHHYEYSPAGLRVGREGPEGRRLDCRAVVINGDIRGCRRLSDRGRSFRPGDGGTVFK